MKELLFPALFTFLCFCLLDCGRPAPASSPPELYLFPQGVASGDPQQEQVLIWTRVVTGRAEPTVELTWEISTDTSFSSTFKSGKVTALEGDNYCVKVIAEGLAPGRTYFYRFLHDNQSSPIGRTRTLPLATDRVRLAIVNCSKFEGGYYNGYDAVTKMHDVDAVVHLGDYIYESPAVGSSGSYRKAFEATGRRHKPEHEILSLEDYRTRFQQYREDNALQELHRLFPMINIWDDHETANNSWMHGAQGHQAEKDGSWEQRKQNALKAFFEWIPIDGEANEPIYRAFDFGGLVNLIMLDTRLCCRTRQAADLEELAAISDTSTLVGQRQLDWIANTITENESIWNVFGNQVLVSRRYSGPESNYVSLDQWTGYPKDRTAFLDILKANPQENFLITTGNVHSSYHFVLLDGEGETTGDTIAHEFLPGSISSSNYDESRTPEEVVEAIADLEAQNPHMPWLDLTNHGFILLDFTPEKALATWYHVSTLYSKDYELRAAYAVDLTTRK